MKNNILLILIIFCLLTFCVFLFKDNKKDLAVINIDKIIKNYSVMLELQNLDQKVKQYKSYNFSELLLKKADDFAVKYSLVLLSDSAVLAGVIDYTDEFTEYLND